LLAAATPAFARGNAVVPTVSFMPAANANYTVAHRPTSSIDLVVIHVTESSAASAISWFRNPKAQASANYVVSKTGRITEMVPDGDIAWHAGNWAINRQSIGIEHEGYTYRAGSFTDTEYRASARLVASEMRHYLLPIDRRHIIGHSQVPDPNHAGLFGGFAHHTDPGRYWNWGRYLTYVKTYARGGTPAPKIVAAASVGLTKAKPAITARVAKTGKISVSSSGLTDGATVSGFVDWTANVASAAVTRVEFLVDGRVRWTQKQKPYRFGGGDGGWDTTKESNGPHVLTLRVVAKNGSIAGQSLRVTVANSPFAIAAASLSNGQTVSKQVRWEAVPSGATADHVDFLVDGKLASTATTAPYLYNGGSLDTTKLGNGPHTLTLRAVSVDGRVAESSATVVVANASAQPKPTPKPAGASIVMTGLTDGGVVSGQVDWQAVTSGATPARVEFWIDGRWRWTERSAPWVFDGDGGTWDTTKEQAGKHVVTVKAVMRDGTVSDWQTFTVTVESRLVQGTSPTPTTMAVVSSLSDGATVHGGVAWTATVSGATPDRVDFYVDGALRHTERSAPYEFGTWDTTNVSNGAHTLVVKATAHDGTSAQASATVQVANDAPAPLAIVSIGGAPDYAATVSGPTPDRVEYYVDGRLRHTETEAPYTFSWDTTRESSGDHVLRVRAVAGRQTAERSVTVTVAGAPSPQPAPAPQTPSPQPPASPLAIVSIGGAPNYLVTVSGPTPDRVDYYVDGQLRHTERSAPYEFAWDATRETPGTHTLLVRARAGTQTAEQTTTVTVAAPADALAVTQSIDDGERLSGTFTWTATPNRDVRRVDFYVDGRWVAVVRSAPYELTVDSSRLGNGSHTFRVRAVAADGTDTTDEVDATVSN
jgi:N-acetylmuramoyl-L-alanine amidase-like protein/Big-like domain-containing protein